jgi:hypothetical protein
MCTHIVPGLNARWKKHSFFSTVPFTSYWLEVHSRKLKSCLSLSMWRKSRVCVSTHPHLLCNLRGKKATHFPLPYTVELWLYEKLTALSYNFKCKTHTCKRKNFQNIGVKEKKRLQKYLQQTFLFIWLIVSISSPIAFYTANVYHLPWSWRGTLGILGFFFFFLAVLGFEHRALHLLDKHTTTRAMFPALFALGYFSDRVSHFFFMGQPWTSTLLLIPPE